MSLVRIGVGLIAIGLASCAPVQYRISALASLRPVDAARPMVVFAQIQGRACGNDAVLGAIRDMKRLAVDGYLEVVVQESGAGEKRCAQVTAYPFRYGSSTATPALRAGGEDTSPLVLEGRTPSQQCALPSSSPAPAASDCAQPCARVSLLVASGAINQALVRDRCLQRCGRPDPSFAACISAAADKASAASCIAQSATTTPEGLP